MDQSRSNIGSALDLAEALEFVAGGIRDCVMNPNNEQLINLPVMNRTFVELVGFLRSNLKGFRFHRAFSEHDSDAYRTLLQMELIQAPEDAPEEEETVDEMVHRIAQTDNKPTD